MKKSFNPIAADAASIERGAALYKVAKCVMCHGKEHVE